MSPGEPGPGSGFAPGAPLPPDRGGAGSGVGPGDGDGALARLASEARACRVCAAHLPLGPRPILHVSTTARVLIASQAPGRVVHERGLSFWDASGDRLRDWLGVGREVFYDAERIAILPMGLCYPGRLANGGDAPPRPECAPLWRAPLLAAMPAIRLTLLIGGHAQDWALGRGRMTDRVRDWRAHLAHGRFPLPHPSWRTGYWASRNPWFDAEVVPALRIAVAKALRGVNLVTGTDEADGAGNGLRCGGGCSLR